MERPSISPSDMVSLPAIPPDLNLAIEQNVQTLVRSAIADGLVSAAHDTSEGGLLVAIAEMLIAADTGASIEMDFAHGCQQ